MLITMIHFLPNNIKTIIDNCWTVEHPEEIRKHMKFGTSILDLENTIFKNNQSVISN